MFKEKAKGFIAGVCVTAMLAGAATVFAQNIDAYIGGIKVYWDGIEKILHDADGNKVEPMIYNGTTYVPLRAMSNLMGKEVDWNQQSLSVYIGQKPTAKTTPIDQFPKEKIDNASVAVLTGKNATFKLKDKTIQCNNLLLGSWSTYYKDKGNIYILDGQYSRFVGKAVMTYENVGENLDGYIAFYSVANDGTKNEIVKYKMKQTQDPIDIDVNLSGVENLEVIFYSGDNDYYAALYDASFLGN